MKCGECCGSFELSARRARAHRAEGEPPRCADCRSTREPAVTPALRKWWLDRFTLDEIRDLAHGLGIVMPISERDGLLPVDE